MCVCRENELENALELNTGGAEGPFVGVNNFKLLEGRIGEMSKS